jgi:hypothetical protein
MNREFYSETMEKTYLFRDACIDERVILKLMVKE